MRGKKPGIRRGEGENLFLTRSRENLNIVRKKNLFTLAGWQRNGIYVFLGEKKIVVIAAGRVAQR